MVEPGKASCVSTAFFFGAYQTLQRVYDSCFAVAKHLVCCMEVGLSKMLCYYCCSGVAFVCMDMILGSDCCVVVVERLYVWR